MSHRARLGEVQVDLLQAPAQEPTHGWAGGEMKKQENRVDGLGHTSLLTKSFQQELLKTLFSFRSDAINGALSAARDFLATSWSYLAGFGQLTHGVIKGADIDVGIALDQGVLETAFDLIGVEVAPVQGAKDKKFRFHTLIIILQLN